MAANVVTTLAPVTNTPAEKLMFGPSDWTLIHTANGALAAVIAAAAGNQHFLKRVDLSFSAAPSDSTLTVKDGTTIIWQIGIPATGPLVYAFDFSGCPLQATEGAALSVNIGTPGGAVVATITAIGKSATRLTAFT